jgi:hypothetical protein
VDPLEVEAEVAAALRALAEVLPVALALIQEDVVLAGDVEDAIRFDRAQDLPGRIEFADLAQVDVVARMDDEGRALGQSVDVADGLFKGSDHVRVRPLVEADVRVGDLHEAEVRRRAGGVRMQSIGQSHRGDLAADEGRHNPRPRQRGAFEKALPGDALVLRVVRSVLAHGVTTSLFTIS